LKLTKLSNFSNLDESLELTKKLTTFNNTELADIINQNKNNEFQMECVNENITFRRESNRANQSKNSMSNNSVNNNKSRNGERYGG